MDYKVYFVATPIGNLKDITLRALEVLKSVDVIACEDTRESAKLLNYYGINKKTVSYHKFNEFSKCDKILEDLDNGLTYAIITDQGMPALQDPGLILVNKLKKENISYTVVPGASSIINALVLSGMDNEKFSFLGFFPKKNKEKEEFLKELENENKTAIFFDTPHSILENLHLLKERLPERKISINRELTKKFEESLCFKLKDLDEEKLILKGEFVLILEKKEQEDENVKQYEDEILNLLNKNERTKDIVKKIQNKSGLSKNEIYDYVVDLKRNVK